MNIFDRLIKLSILGLAGLSLLSINPIPATARPQSPQVKSMMSGAGDRSNGLIQLKSNLSIEACDREINAASQAMKALATAVTQP
jgi:hypothetical protein